MSESVTLFVDLDGTLLRSDLLYESIVRLIRQAPGQLLRAPWWLLRGKARLKHELAQRVRLDAATLPYNDAMCAYLVHQRAQGRPLVLATGSNRRQAEAVAKHLGFFNAVLASNAHDNLTGHRKLQAIQAHNGGAFAYAGNARDDILIWHQAERAVAVGAPEHIVQDLRQRGRLELEIPVPSDRFALLRALRPQQWLKNLLVFLPALAVANTLNQATFWACCGAFVAFCLCASAIYLVNDLSDLEADRAHPLKRFRPFASGAASIAHGLMAVPILLGAAFAIATTVSSTVVGVLGGYLLLTTAYTFVLKAYAIVDVLSLAALYALRVLAGSAAIAVAPSFWMLAFSVFIFFSLALAKRAAELHTARTLDLPKARGRGYRVDDDSVVQMMGIAAGYLSVGVMALYLNSPEVVQRYHHPQWLWGLCPMLLLWVSRIWLKAVRGELIDDPLVFAVRDLQSRLVVVAATLLIVSAMLL